MGSTATTTKKGWKSSSTSLPTHFFFVWPIKYTEIVKYYGRYFVFLFFLRTKRDFMSFVTLLYLEKIISIIIFHWKNEGIIWRHLNIFHFFIFTIIIILYLMDENYFTMIFIWTVVDCFIFNLTIKDESNLRNFYGKYEFFFASH